jgi:hypothetical protein
MRWKQVRSIVVLMMMGRQSAALFSTPQSLAIGLRHRETSIDSRPNGAEQPDGAENSERIEHQIN